MTEADVLEQLIVAVRELRRRVEALERFPEDLAAEFDRAAAELPRPVVRGDASHPPRLAIASAGADHPTGDSAAGNSSKV